MSRSSRARRCWPAVRVLLRPVDRRLHGPRLDRGGRRLLDLCRRLPGRDLARRAAGDPAAPNGRPAARSAWASASSSATSSCRRRVRIAIPPTVGFLVQLDQEHLARRRSSASSSSRARASSSPPRPSSPSPSISPSPRSTSLLCFPLTQASRVLETEAPCRSLSSATYQALRRHRPCSTACRSTSSTGEIIAIIGRSGSGKSTLLRCINGLEPIQAGTHRRRRHRVNDPDDRPAQAAPACRHRVPELQPVSAPLRREEHHARARRW